MRCRALVEEIVRAVAMSEIVELPRLVRSPPAAHDFLVHKHVDGTEVPHEISSIGIRFCQLRRCDLCIMLRRCRRPGASQVARRERHIRHVIPDVIQRHDDHDDATQQVNRVNALGNGRRLRLDCVRRSRGSGLQSWPYGHHGKGVAGEVSNSSAETINRLIRR
jgi:hypothetical protein